MALVGEMQYLTIGNNTYSLPHGAEPGNTVTEVGTTTASGSSTAFSREDHVHKLTAAAGTAVGLASTGYVTGLPISTFTNDKGYITQGQIPPGAAAYDGPMSKVGQTTAAGSSNAFARGDHVHSIVPSDFGLATTADLNNYVPVKSTYVDYFSSTATIKNPDDEYGNTILLRVNAEEDENNYQSELSVNRYGVSLYGGESSGLKSAQIGITPDILNGYISITNEHGNEANGFYLDSQGTTAILPIVVETTSSEPMALVTNSQLSASGLQNLIDGSGSSALHQVSNIATANYAFAEGYGTSAIGVNSHAEGNQTCASGSPAHAEGFLTKATGGGSHAEGTSSKAIGTDSHAEGYQTCASGSNSHAEGYKTKAASTASHSEGYQTTAEGSYSHAEGESTYAQYSYCHAEGTGSQAKDTGAHAEGYKSVASKPYAHAEGYATTANGYASHSEGYQTLVSGYFSHAEGQQTTAAGSYSHTEGFTTYANGYACHAEGYQTTANGTYASHTEGYNTKANGNYSHAEGNGSKAEGSSSHAEGATTTASGDWSHAEGNQTLASGNCSHTNGWGTVANTLAQTAIGKYNIIPTTTADAFIIGNGSSTANRSNAMTIDWDGNVNLPSTASQFQISSTNILELIYPIGSIYMSTNNTLPAALVAFGTWTQIKDVFLLAAGDAYSAGSTGGSATIEYTPAGSNSATALTVDQIPSHYHFTVRNSGGTTATPTSSNYIARYTSSPNSDLPYSMRAVSSAPNVGRTSSTGSGSTHNHTWTGTKATLDNMPPYKVVYAWQRTA